MFVHDGLTYTYKVEKKRTEPTVFQKAVETVYTNSIAKANVIFQDLSVNFIIDPGLVTMYFHDETCDQPVIIRKVPNDG